MGGPFIFFPPLLFLSDKLVQKEGRASEHPPNWSDSGKFIFIQNNIDYQDDETIATINVDAETLCIQTVPVDGNSIPYKSMFLRADLCSSSDVYSSIWNYIYHLRCFFFFIPV